MRLKFYVIFSITIITTSAFAQKQNVYYLNNNGKEVTTSDSVDFTRIISEPDSGQTFYNIREYYKNGKIKLVGKTSKTDNRNLQGQCISFYPSGKKKQVSTFISNLTTGSVYDYYPNGALYRIVDQIKPGNADFKIDDERRWLQLEPIVDQKGNVSLIKPNPDAITFSIVTEQDSLGNALVTNGTGHYIEFDPAFKEITTQGNLKNGLKDSIWIGKTIVNSKVYNNVYTFIENYHDGKLLSGQSTDVIGKTYKYNLRFTNAEYPGKEVAFDNYVQKNIRYPYMARQERVQSAAYIQFVVEPDGSLSNFKTLYNPGYGFGDESIRVIKGAGKWIPGTAFGCPIRVQFTIPVNFSLK